MQEHFLTSGRQALDFVGVTHAPLFRVPLDALQHGTHAAEPYPGQTADRQVSAVTGSLATGKAASAVTSPSPAVLERVNQDQLSSFLRV